jgi:hypothetical protein
VLGWVLAGVGLAVSWVLFGQTFTLSCKRYAFQALPVLGGISLTTPSGGLARDHIFIIPIVLLRYVPPGPGGTITAIKSMATSNSRNRPVPPQPIHEPTRCPCWIISSAKGFESTIGDHNGFNTFLTQSMSMVISSPN